MSWGVFCLVWIGLALVMFSLGDKGIIVWPIVILWPAVAFAIKVFSHGS